MDAVARDVKWLHATLETVAKADPFTGRLLKISKQIHEEAPLSAHSRVARGGGVMMHAMGPSPQTCVCLFSGNKQINNLEFCPERAVRCRIQAKVFCSFEMSAVLP